MRPIQIGDEIERYRVEGVLGEGGMGTVYRVRHLSLDTQHALKILQVLRENLLARLMLEGRIQARLDHPNIVAVTDVLNVNGFPGLLMRFVDGPSLATYLETPIPLVRALNLFRGIVDGVDAAHHIGVVHRDLKPGNILLAPIRGGHRPMICDFGLVKALNEEGATRTGIGFGTPGYLAPEQATDAKNVDQRADIYALGAILYELVAGRRAYVGDNPISVISRQVAGDLPPMEACPPGFSELVRTCLAISPHDRYPDCGELLADLERRVDPEGRPRLVPPRAAVAATMAFSADLLDEVAPGQGAVGVTAVPVTGPTQRPALDAAANSPTSAHTVDLSGTLPPPDSLLPQDLVAGHVAPASLAPDPERHQTLAPVARSVVVPEPPPIGTQPGGPLSAEPAANLTLGPVSRTDVEAGSGPGVGSGSTHPVSQRARWIVFAALLCLGTFGAFLSLDRADEEHGKEATPSVDAVLTAPEDPPPDPSPAVPPAPTTAAPETPADLSPTAIATPVVTPAAATMTGNTGTKVEKTSPSRPSRGELALTTSAPAVVTTAPVAAAPPPAAAAPTIAELRASSIPAGATVLVDGVKVGQTPARFKTPVGSHTVSLTDGTTTHSGKVEVPAEGARFCWDFQSGGPCP